MMAVSPPLWLRGRYYGVRASDPSTVGLQAGSYWYRSDLHCWKWFDGTSINFLPLLDVMVIGEFMKLGAGAGSVTGTMTATELSGIVLLPQLDVIRVRPPQYDIYTPIHWNISANTIGVTIGMASSAAGTTVTVQAEFLGWR